MPQRSPATRYLTALAGAAAGAAIGAGTAAGAALVAPGITAAAGGALAAGAARSSTLAPLPRAPLERPSFELKASASVQAKNTAAHAAVDRDRKFALPLAPNNHHQRGDQLKSQ